MDISAVEGAISADVSASLNATFGNLDLLNTYSPIAWANALVASEAAAGGVDAGGTSALFNNGAPLGAGEAAAVTAAIAANAPSLTATLRYEPEVTHV